MAFSFDYPITRPYPWRYSTISVVVISALFVTVIVYLNLVFVGTTISSRSSSAFEEAETLSWVNRLNIRKTLSAKLGCESTTLVAGGNYRTHNGAFTYAIQNFVDRQDETDFSSIQYTSSILNNCSTQTMGMFVNFVSMDAFFEAKINCSLSDKVDMIATTSSPITRRLDIESNVLGPFDGKVPSNESTSYMGPSVSGLLTAFGLDYINQFLTAVPKKNSQLPISTIYAPFSFFPGTTIYHEPATCSLYGSVWTGPSIAQYASNWSMAVYENYAQVFSSAILSDIGASAEPNILTDISLFNQTIKSGIPLDRVVVYGWINGTGADWVLSHLDDFRLPYDKVVPTYFNARYMCRYTTWKKPSNLIIDVLVATTSFFMVFWSALNLLLRYFATKSSVHGNHCTSCMCEQPAPKLRDSSILQRPCSYPEPIYEPLPAHPNVDTSGCVYINL